MSNDSWSRVLLWAVPALVGYAIFLFVPDVMADGDTFSHVATGEWMLRHGAVPTTDPFSYTFAGAPWVAHEWLSELLMGLAFQGGGWIGVLMLCGAAYGLALGNLARHLARRLDPVPTVVVFVLAAACTRPSMLARPHILALPVLELWAAGLLIARERETVPWLLLPLMLAWANLHGSFMFGLALACPFAAEAVWSAGPRWRRTTARWGLFLAAAAALATATPQGWHGLLFPLQLLQLKQLAHIGEWQPPDFQVVQPIELALVATLYVCLTRSVRVPALRVAVLIGLLHLSIQHTRHQMLAGVVGALILAQPVCAMAGLAERRAPARLGRRPAFVFAAAILAVTATRLARPFALANTPTAPIAAVDHVPPELAAQPVLNDYAFGGYLIFRGVRPYIDARADMYGDPFLAEYAAMVEPDRARLLRTLDERRVQWAILTPGSPLANILGSLRGWERLFGDQVAVVFARSR